MVNTAIITLADAWVHDLNPVLLPIAGPFAIRWYGLSYLLGFVVAFLLLRALAKRGTLRIPPGAIADALFILIVGVIVGGRLGYALFYNPALLGFTDQPPFWRMLQLNEGGMASHGGMIGVTIAAFVVARRHAIPRLHVADAVAVAAAPGLLFGRIANFINAELLGRVVADPGQPAPWYAVRFPTEMTERPAEWAERLTDDQAQRLADLLTPIERELEQAAGQPVPTEAVLDAAVTRVQSGDGVFARQLGDFLTARHPSQLYQALAEGVLVFVVLAIVWAKPRRAGVVGAWFLVVYGAGRIATELFRLPDIGVTGALGLSRGQLLSAGMIAGGVAALAVIRARETPIMGGWHTVATNDTTHHAPTSANEDASESTIDHPAHPGSS